MGMPQVPQRDTLPGIKDVVIQILESVAIEELAMAHILNAEGEKMQATIAQFEKNSLCFESVNEAFKNTNLMLNSLIMKEWVMLNKINTALDIYNNIQSTACDCKHRVVKKVCECHECKC